MAAITDIKINDGSYLLAEATSGEVGLPGEPYLTIKDAVWKIEAFSATNYLQKFLNVTGVAAQRPFNAKLKLTSLGGDKFRNVKLSQ
jgi:hypothetical protein